MIEAILVAGMIAAPKNPTTELLEPKPITKTVQVEKPVELTLEQKIKTNHFKCDTQRQYIRADNAECLDKPVASQRAVVGAVRSSGGVNTYEPGQCVWALKEWRPELPNTWGSATTWLSRAEAMGWPTGSEPRVGAVGWVYGHVVLIIAVNSDGTVDYKDMNGRWIPFEIGYGTKDASYYKYIY